MITIGERIVQLRRELNLSQESLSQKLNISRASLSLYELNKNEPPDSVKRSMADFFNVTLDYLCGYSDFRTNFEYTSLDGMNYVKVPIVESVYDMSKIVKGYTFIPEEKVIDGNFFFIAAPNDFSLDRVKKGDLLYIKEQSYIDSSEEYLALICLDNELMLKRIGKYKSEYILFNSSTGPSYTLVPMDNLTIIGVVIEVTFSL